MSGLYLITAPTADVVSLEDAKAHLRITSDDQNDMIEATVQACAGALDPASGGWLGRALRPQTWELRLRGFSCPYDRNDPDFRYHMLGGYERSIELRFPPLTSIDSVKYDDADGVEQTLVSGTDYRVVGIGALGKAHILPAYGRSWPSSRNDVESVRIRYTCGYSDDPDVLPKAIRSAILLGMGHLWSLGSRDPFLSSKDIPGVGSKSWTLSENAGNVFKTATESLLSSYRVYD